MNFLLEVTDYTQPVSDFMDRLTFGGLMLLVGMAVVFLVLILLWISLSLFKVFFAKEPAEKTAEPPVVTKSVTPVSAEGEIIAAIAAAIAMAESESDGIKFRVVSFKRK